MPLFGRRRAHTARAAGSRRGGPFSRRHRDTAGHSTRYRKDPDRVAGGYKAALSNPNTTKEGRQHAKYELEAMGRGKEAHVSLATKIKRALGIRSTPRNRRREAYSAY